MAGNNENRWKSLSEVHLPPIEKKGFKNSVLDIKAYSIHGEDAPGVVPVSMEASLIRLVTNEKIDIAKDKFTIGKGKNADYKIEGNSAISREHAELIQEYAKLYIRDLKSLNHTYVNGGQIAGKTEIFDADIIGIADEEFIVNIVCGSTY